MRVVFYVRCHGEPNEEIEQNMMNEMCEVVEWPEMGWGILTIGRSYHHDTVFCPGHPDPKDECAPATPREDGNIKWQSASPNTSGTLS